MSNYKVDVLHFNYALLLVFLISVGHKNAIYLLLSLRLICILYKQFNLETNVSYLCYTN